MRTNDAADTIYNYLIEKHNRVYRNKSPQSPVFPYVVYRIESVMNTYPSEDLYVNIDVYEESNKSVRVMEDLADTIDKDLNMKVFNTSELNLHFVRDGRNYVPTEELVSAHMINLRYAVRAYFK